jgi:hypothetical protein
VTVRATCRWDDRVGHDSLDTPGGLALTGEVAEPCGDGQKLTEVRRDRLTGASLQGRRVTDAGRRPEPQTSAIRGERYESPPVPVVRAVVGDRLSEASERHLSAELANESISR